MYYNLKCRGMGRLMAFDDNMAKDSNNGESLRRLLEYTAAYEMSTGSPMLAYVHSFGCQQNVSDGEKLMGKLAKAGFGFTDEPEKARLIILNTCAVRENAEDRVYGILGRYKKLKENDPQLVIGVCGCMAQQQCAADRIKNSFRYVDLVFGTFVTDRIYDMLWKVISGRLDNRKERVFDLSDSDTTIHEDLVQMRRDKVKAFVPIMYGCNNFCTYCIVPYVRGRERSRTPEAVIEEVKGLVASGYKEITLLGQNVNSYSYGFAGLLRKINEIDGDFWVRFMSSHPKDAGRELIDTIIDCDKICTHLHLPVQAGSDRILKAMNRRYTVNDYMKIVDYARGRDKEFSFTTDIIVGFPGESYEEFCMTKELIRKVRYDNIYSFVYSKRTGTKAAEFEDNIPDSEKGQWLRELLLEQRETSQEWLSRYVGKTLRVLADGAGKTDGTLTGKSYENIIVNFSGGEQDVGRFVDVKITCARNWALEGEIVK